MSSAILYLAIIAIWACVLVPRWIHKPHRVPEADELPGLQYVGVAGRPASRTRRAASASGDAPPAAWAAASAATAGARVSGDTGARAAAGAGADDGGAGEARDGEANGTAARRPAAEEGVAWHRVTQRRSYHSDRQVPEEYQAHHAPGRARILQARRRLLTTLVALAAVALACAAAKFTPWWILVPPAGILGVYLLVLREAAQADAEQARWLAHERAAEAEAARLRARQAWEATPPQPTAKIIDISARVTDQLYDQYADAAVRAVGD